MPKSDEEVFEHFRNDYPDNPNLEIALLAYARYAQSKYDWVAHRRIHGNPPTDAEVTEWIADLPNSRLLEIHAGAGTFFKAAADDYLKTHIAEERKSAVETSILGRVDDMARRVERATSLRATWFPSTIIGIVSSFVFALLVLGGAAVYRGDPSIFALFKEAPGSSAPATK